jgi:transcriptional regulator with XRE-family HTH domain
LNVKEIRMAKGLSVAALAALTGIHRRTLEDIEKRGDCMASNAVKLASALGVTLDELCGGKGG